MAIKAINDLPRGDTRRYKFTFDDGLSPTPAVINITGQKIFFSAKINEDDADVDAVIAVNATAGDDGDDDPVNGVMHLTLKSTDTAVPIAKYYYDFQRVISGSPPDVLTIDKNKFKITQDITLADV